MIAGRFGTGNGIGFKLARYRYIINSILSWYSLGRSSQKRGWRAVRSLCQSRAGAPNTTGMVRSFGVIEFTATNASGVSRKAGVY